MADYTRKYVPGAVYFFTLVTFERRSFLITEEARQCLRRAWLETQAQLPFDVEAVCLLPDHLHCLWTLPEGDADFSRRWKTLKGRFSHYYGAAGGVEGRRSLSRRRTGERAFWQRRFWEHCVLDEGDYANHFDYIHFNAVKHGLAARPEDWPWSSFHRYAGQGWYDADWGGSEPRSIRELKSVGE